jgi:malate/lactate dehydrogenase
MAGMRGAGGEAVMKVGIAGAGAVGSSAAYATALQFSFLLLAAIDTFVKPVG